MRVTTRKDGRIALHPKTKNEVLTPKQAEALARRLFEAAGWQVD